MFGVKFFDDPIYKRSLSLVRGGTEYELNRKARLLMHYIDNISIITGQDSEDILLRLEGKVHP